MTQMGSKRNRVRGLSVSACVLVGALAVATAAFAQAGKKVYISVDLEGISGISGDDQTSAGAPEYGRARKLMAEDANAAIRGAFEAAPPTCWSTTRTGASAICFRRIWILVRGSSATASSGTG